MTATKPAQPDDSLTPTGWAGKRLHFVGIGGCGMSGLARLARQTGARCSGSDMAPSSVIEALRHDGFEISLEQSAQAVPVDCHAVIISAAIGPDHPEVAEAKRRGLRVLKYAQMLGQLMVGRTGIAIAGTHGKSTTSSMLAHILLSCGRDPSFIIGATCRQIGGGCRSGADGEGVLVAEACEFDRSFHHLHPVHGVILNVEEDHMDVYPTIDAVVEAFAVFARRLPHHGTLLIHHEMAHRLTITAGLDCQVQTLGFAPQANWHLEVLNRPDTVRHVSDHDTDSHLDPRRRTTSVVLHEDGHSVARWEMVMPGEHMAYNAAAAAVTAHRLGVSWESITAALTRFQGLDRRMQQLGHRAAGYSGKPGARGHHAGVTVVDDYGHHPTEIDTTLRALRRHYQPRRLVCVFQPHQHSRTRFLMEQFAASFGQADMVIVPHIYFVRDSEQERHIVSARDLVDRLRQRGKQAAHVYPFAAITEQLEVLVRDGDLVVTMGAGDVWQVAQAFLAHGGQQTIPATAVASGGTSDPRPTRQFRSTRSLT